MAGMWLNVGYGTGRCRPLLVVAALLAAALGSVCERRPTLELRDVTLPDLSRVDTAVQEQLRQQYSALQAALARADATPDHRAAEYGRLGMLLHAAEYYDAAEPAYLNAQSLAPMEPRWPYYLAHLYKNRGQVDRSSAAFSRVLELRPDDVPALVWLARASLERGDAAEAERLLARADTLAPRTVAVLAARGQTALLRKDFSAAAARFEEALAVDPSAASLHSPLATAYRALGDSTRAESHARQWRNTEILIPDPLRQDLDLALGSALSYELRGVRALEARDFATAADFFRQGSKVADASTALGRSLRHKLGTALYLGGDVDGAVEQFTAVVRAGGADRDESVARAHYSLGILHGSQGRVDEAIEHLAEAVEQSGTYVEARQALADMLRRARRDELALPQYAEVLRLSPQASEARFGYAMALVRLRRYKDARDWMTEATELHPDRGEFKHALARLLAAAPDDTVRDGPRALELIDELLKGPRSVALGETTAMALAESGRFDEAVAVQRRVIEAARAEKGAIDLAFMTANLRRYEMRRPCRTPWNDADSMQTPGAISSHPLP